MAVETGDLAAEAAAEPAADGWLSRYARVAVITDGCVALVAGLAALYARHPLLHLPRAYVIAVVILPFIWVGSLALAGGYESRFVGTGAEEFRRMINAGVGLVAAIAILAYVTRSPVPRSYVLAAIPAAVGLNLVSRYLLRKRLHRMRAAGACMRRVVAVGHADDVAHLISELRREPYHGMEVVTACIPGPATQRLADVAGVPVRGGHEDVAEVVRQSGADTVAVLACPEMNGGRLRRLAWELEKTDTDLCLAPALLDVAGPRTSIRQAAGLPLLYMDHPDLSGVRQVGKSIFDKLAAGSALILLSPLMLTVALAIRLEDGGPSLFRQVRVGKDGRPFRVYKFRTMVVGAEHQKAALASRNEVNGVLFKIREDPRLTRLGGRLRSWSVDEIPQLLNVLKGEMSLVGPRPWAQLPYEEAAGSGEHVWRRVAVKPGLTGLWQVSGRADLPWEESVRLDIRYVENWSFALDLQILWKTVRAVLQKSGAY